MEQGVTGRFLPQKITQRPQSLQLLPPIAIPQLQLQTQQHQSFAFPKTDAIQTMPTTNQHNFQCLPNSSANTQSTSSFIKRSGRSSPHPIVSSVEKQRLQKHPQFWCGKGQTEPTASKHVYNYAQRKDIIEKTPMCKVAELARYNKLRHEYVLLDESGPAHKKKFTVKLILCQGQEFEGNGPSIKKAQQAAAQTALDLTILPRPSQQLRGTRRVTKKEEPSNPILLLNSVASQIGIIVHYKEEIIRQSVPGKACAANLNTPNNLATLNGFQNFLPQFCYNAPALFPTSSSPFSPVKSLTSILDLAVPSPINLGATALFPLLYPRSVVDVNVLSPNPNVTYPIMPVYPNNQSISNGPPTLFGSNPVQNMNLLNYKVTITLNFDSSKHIGFGSSLLQAKQKAATLALAHLKPELERFKREKENSSLMQINQRTGTGVPYDENSHALLGCEWNDSTSTTQNGREDVMENSGNREQYMNGQQHKDEKSPIKDYDYVGIEIEGLHAKQRKKSKSVVSQIHECALRLRMNVEFEVLAETGEPHNRVYTLRCRLSSPSIMGTFAGNNSNGSVNKEYQAEGKGPSKKAAKQAACQQLLDQVRCLLDNDPIQLATQIVRRTEAVHKIRSNVKTANNNSTNNAGKRKTIVKDKKIDPEYGHHINPISRLIQVMQVRQQKDPIFQLVSEQGQNRHKEFTVTVQCMGLEVQGVGPNKKLAKRAAAEAMLARIGYVKPMLQPGKSLLKKKLDQENVNFMEIGHFDADEAADSNTWNGELPKSQRHHHLDTFETFADVKEALREGNEGNGMTAELGGSKQQSRSSPSLTESPENCHSLSSPSPNEDQDKHSMAAIRSQKRRVTFSEHVSACPPPEDSNYPEASIAPLKELGGRIKRRSRDSQRVLSQEETKKFMGLVRLYLSWQNSENDKKGLVEVGNEWNLLVDGFEKIDIGTEENNSALMEQQKMKANLLRSPPPPLMSQLPNAALPTANNFTAAVTGIPIGKMPSSLLTINTQMPIPNFSLPDSNGMFVDKSSTTLDASCHNKRLGLMGAKKFLDCLAKQFKFSVAYSDFPKSQNALNEEQCFTLLTLGLDKPIVCHGSGSTEIDAHNDAAFNAIRNSLLQLDSGK